MVGKFALSDKAYRHSVLHGLKTYWQIIAFAKALKFKFSSRVFQIGRWKRDTTQSASIFLHLAKSAIGYLVGASAIVILLTKVESRLFPALTLISEKFDLVSVYSNLAQISGLIVGLYFTAISVVVSTVYSKVPDDVRNLIARERMGDSYVSIAILLGAISLVELALLSVGSGGGAFPLFVGIFLAILTLVTVPLLVHRLFYFFDPARLAETYIFPEVLEWAGLATCSGYSWGDASFQNHYSRQVSGKLITYRRIIELLLGDARANNSSLTRLIAKELSFLSYYIANLKNKIPSNSRWFRFKLQHQKWFETNSSAVEIALRAGISLQHKEVPNPNWLEAQVAENVSDVLRHLLATGDLDNALELMQYLQQTCNRIVKNLSYQEAYMLTEARDKVFREFLDGVTVENNRGTLLAMVDFYAADYVAIPIQCANSLKQISSTAVQAKLRKVNWKAAASVYRANFPTRVIPELEKMLPLKANQLSIEPDAAVPEWYDLQLIANAYLGLLSSMTEEICARFEEVFSTRVKISEDTTKNLLTLQIVTRGLEACHKMETYLETAKSIGKGLVELKVVKDIPGPDIDWEKHTAAWKRTREAVIDKLGALCLITDWNNAAQDLPDYFGQAYWVVADECFDALCEKDAPRFQKLYALFFGLAQIAWNLTRSSMAREKNKEFYTNIFADVLKDVMAIGGYAKLFNEFHGDGYWAAVQETWDKALTTLNANRKPFISAFVACVNYDPLMTMTVRSLQRTRWQQIFEGILSSETDIPDEYGNVRHRGHRKQVVHPSALLRTFGHSHFYNPETVFAAFYLRAQPELGESDLGRKTQQFISDLVRETEEEAAA